MRLPFRRRGPARRPTEPLVAIDAGLEERMREAAGLLIGPGFLERSDAYVTLTDGFDEEDVPPASLEAAAHRIVDEVWAAREAELATAAGTPDDHARLAAAFDALGRRGVVARMNFTCCQTCGSDEIGDERTPVQPGDVGAHWRREWAYTYFHQQDTERLHRGEPVLHLAFGAFGPAPDADRDDVDVLHTDEEARRRVMAHSASAAGALVRTALEEQGLEVAWGGSSTERLQVAVTDWRRPLPA